MGFFVGYQVTMSFSYIAETPIEDKLHRVKINQDIGKGFRFEPLLVIQTFDWLTFCSFIRENKQPKPRIILEFARVFKPESQYQVRDNERDNVKLYFYNAESIGYKNGE